MTEAELWTIGVMAQAVAPFIGLALLAWLAMKLLE